MVVTAFILFVDYQGVSDVNVQEINNRSVYIKSVVFNDLKLEYSESVNEVAYCLEGSNIDGLIMITNITKPYTYKSSPNQVVYDIDDCKYSLGTLHFHIQDEDTFCYPSDQDIYGYGLREGEYHNLVVNIVLCNQSYFVFKPEFGSVGPSYNLLEV
jgi:hypothetical protein